MQPINYAPTGLGQEHIGEQNNTITPLYGACDETISDPRSASAKATVRVLVVDDEVVSRKLLTVDLESSGYTVATAVDGAEAIDAVSHGTFDLVLMDINMPRLDGFMALRLIRQMDREQALPVIMMTADANAQQISRCFENGANDYLAKPVTKAELIARVDAQLRFVKAKEDLRESEQRYALATNGTREGIWDWNLRTGELYLSKRWHEIVGTVDWKPEGRGWLSLVHHDDRSRVQADLESHLCGEVPFFESELRMADHEGDLRWMLCRGIAVRDSSGMATRIAGSLSDITEGKVADALTGLPNRILFNDRASRCIEQYRRNSCRLFAILYLDLNDFKLINDSLGHSAGDEFLVEVANRLQRGVRKCDAILARLGGDEFGILVENIKSVNDALIVAKRIEKSLAPPIRVAHQEVLPQCSIGIAMIDSVKTTTDELIRKADTAMYEAKQSSTTQICVFDKQMQLASAAKLKISSELHHAIDRNEFQLYFQPIIDVQKMVTAGFEALARWDHPAHGRIPPSEFIPLAESNGVIIEMGKWILREACQHVATWNSVCDFKPMVSVNVSIRQLSGRQFISEVRECIDKAGISPAQLKLEVTESLLMRNPDETIAILNELRDIGVTTSIDDFGTGYSSLAYLHQMPLDVLKIDRSFVQHLQNSSKHQAIVRSIMMLASSLDLRVIAEGIETAEQAAYLSGLGCDYFQGFHFSRPVNAAETLRLLECQW